MPDFIDSILSASRLLLEVPLKPAQGERFQPTGFADLGAAQYTTPDGRKMLLVESAQSVANRLERTVLDDDGVSMRPAFKGLPWVRATLTGQGEGVVTSSLVEAHRLNSPFIVTDEKFAKEFKALSGYRKGQVINWGKAARAVMYFDPCALLHGVFFANIEDGRLRFPRMVTGFIEAADVGEVASGGVKNNHFDPSGEVRAENYDKDVYGNVPYSRLEFTAKEIRAYFNVDLAQLRGYALPRSGRRLLVALALYKIRRFLEDGLRLRTACDFRMVGELSLTSPVGPVIPSIAELEALVVAEIAAARQESGLLAPEPFLIETKTVKKAKKGDTEAAEGTA